MKKLLIAIGLLLVIVLLVWFVFVRVTTRITFSTDDISTVSVTGFGSIGLKTADKSKIQRVVEYLDSIAYYKVTEREAHNQSPDTSILMINKEGKAIDRIDFYGDLVEYRGNQYRVIPFMYYGRLEKLCNKLNAK